MAHNRCVLKERRIPPGALTCFAVVECQGWRLGLVGGGGSAGSVLRSPGTLGPAGLSRCRATGIRMSTFLCSLRPDPAAASWFGGSMREPDSRRFGMRHRFSEEGLHDLQDLGPSARGLVRHVGRGGLRGEGLRSQETCPSDAFALRAMREQDVHVPMPSPALPATARRQPRGVRSQRWGS
jgi:hypothetical protein